MHNASTLGACIYNTETSLIRAKARQGLPLTASIRICINLTESLRWAQEDADKVEDVPGHKGRARWLRTYNQLHIRHKTVPHAYLLCPSILCREPCPHTVPTSCPISRDVPTNPFLPFALLQLPCSTLAHSTPTAVRSLTSML